MTRVLPLPPPNFSLGRFWGYVTCLQLGKGDNFVQVFSSTRLNKPLPTPTANREVVDSNSDSGFLQILGYLEQHHRMPRTSPMTNQGLYIILSISSSRRTCHRDKYLHIRWSLTRGSIVSPCISSSFPTDDQYVHFKFYVCKEQHQNKKR